MINKNTLVNLQTLIYLGCLSFIILLQDHLAPFANKVAEYDDGVFIYSAKEMINGALIYKDIFDHKGPLLYLLNIFGLVLFGGNLSGIWMVDLIFLGTAALFMFKAAHLFVSRFIALLAVTYALLLLAVLEPSNGTQFYALPLLSIALYLFLKYFIDNRNFTVFELAIIACSCTLTFLLQPNLIPLWLGFGLVASAKMLKEKNYLSLSKNLLVVFAAIAVTLIPFLLYAIKNNLLPDAISCVWTFNRANSNPSFIKAAAGVYYALVNIDKGHAVIPVVFYLGYLALHYKEGNHRALHAGIALSFLLSLFIGCGLSGHNFPHYAIIMVPLICIITALCLDYLQQKLDMTSWLLILTVVIFSWRLVLSQANYSYQAFKPDNQVKTMVEFIQNHTYKSDKIAVVGNDSQLYYLSGRKSSSKYHYTFPILNVQKFKVDMTHEYLNDLRTNKPKLLIIKTGDYPQPPDFIREVLAENYKLLPYEDTAVNFYMRRSEVAQDTK